MSVSPEDVEHIARLARLAVPAEELPALTAQLDRIVTFVAQLASVPADTTPMRLGNSAAPLREDVVQPAGLAAAPETLAPEFAQGFFVVPRLGALEEP